MYAQQPLLRGSINCDKCESWQRADNLQSYATQRLRNQFAEAVTVMENKLDGPGQPKRVHAQRTEACWDTYAALQRAAR